MAPDHDFLSNSRHDESIYVHQVRVLNKYSHFPVDLKYKLVFNVYTGSFERGYNFHYLDLAPGQSNINLLASEHVANTSPQERRYIELRAQESHGIFLSITSSYPGIYDLQIEIVCRIGGVDKSLILPDRYRFMKPDRVPRYLKADSERVLDGGVGWWIDRTIEEEWKSRPPQTIQVGAFKKRDNAFRLCKRMRELGYAAYIAAVDQLQMVRVGFFRENYTLTQIRMAIENTFGAQTQVIVADSSDERLNGYWNETLVELDVACNAQ